MGLPELAIKIVILAIVLYVILFLFLPALIDWYVSNQTTVKKNISTICNLDQIILDSIDEAMIQNIKNEQAQEIASRIIRGDDVPECDYKLFLDLLDSEERKKLNLLKFSCNFINCI